MTKKNGGPTGGKASRPTKGKVAAHPVPKRPKGHGIAAGSFKCAQG